MLAPFFALLFLFFSTFANAALDQPRDARRAQLVGQLNSQFNCKIMLFTSAEQITYAREMSLPECAPTSGGNYLKASQLLKALAEVSVPVDAEALREQAQSFNDVAIQAMSLDEFRDKLLYSGVIKVQDGEITVDRIGHLFQSAELNSTRWLEAYVTAVRKMSEHFSANPNNPVDGCVEPLCDPAIYQIAEAVTARPPLELIYYADQKEPVAPNPYALSYFSQQYASNSKIRRALGLNKDHSSLWNVDNFSSYITDTGELMFTELFAPASNVTVSIANWNNHKEFPFVVPFFLLFQEASDVLDLIRSVGPNEVGDHIRDIRFEPALENAPLLSLGKISDGEYILHIRILNSPGDVGLASTRALLRRQIPAFLKVTAQLAQQ